MSLSVVDASYGRQTALVDAAAAPDRRVLDVVDLVARHRAHVARERRRATGKHRRQPELGYVSRHTSVSFNTGRANYRKRQTVRRKLHERRREVAKRIIFKLPRRSPANLCLSSRH